MKHFLSILLLGLAAGCASTSSLSIDELENSLLEADRAFSAHSAEHGFAAAFDAYLAEDALQFPRGVDPIEGHIAIVEFMEAQPPSLITWEPQAARAAPSGEMGYTWGRFEARPDGMPDADVLAAGKYVTIWVRGPRGDWKVALDIGNE